MPSRRQVLLSNANGPSLDLTFMTGSLDSRVTFTRSSVASYFDATGTLQSAATNTPRFDYGASPGGVTNWVLNSTAFGAVSADSTELITNGDFAVDPINASQNTVQNGWQWSRSGGSVAATWDGTAILLLGDGTNAARVDQSFATTSGVTYTLTVTVGGSGGPTLTTFIGPTQGSSSLFNSTISAGTARQIQFTASSSTTWLRFNRSVATTATIDNVSVKSAGKLPTNSLLSTTVLREVTAGIYQDMPGFYVRVFGIPDATSARTVGFSTGLTYVAGDTWSISVYIALTAGTLTNSTGIQFRLFNEGGATTVAPTSTLTRYTNTRTGVNTGDTARPTFRWNHSDTTTAVDFTLFFAAPQAEKGSIVNAWVPTSTVAENVGSTPLGLLIEESRTNSIRNNTTGGAVAGSSTDLITNGTFALNPLHASSGTLQNGWIWPAVSGSSTISWVSNAILMSPDGTNTVRLDTSITTVSGLSYLLVMDVGSNTITLDVGTAQGGNQNFNSTIAAGTAQKVMFVASATTTWIRLRRTTAGDATIDNVSVISAGKAATNWTAPVITLALVVSIAGTGTENGIPYVDYSMVGTTDGGAFRINCDANNVQAASVGQVWTHSGYCRLVSGSLTGITTFQPEVREYSNGVGVIQNATTITPTGAPLSSQRYSHTRTLTDATTTHVQATFRIATTTSAVINCVVRIGLSQLELGSFPTSPISTSTVAVSRSPDVAIVADNAWLRPQIGSIVADFLPPVAASGISNQIIFQVDTGSSTVRALLYLRAGATSIRQTVEDASGTSGTNDIAAATIGVVNRAGMTYSLNDTSACLNGATPLTTALIREPGVFTTMRLGTNTSQTGVLNGYIRRIRYWGRVLSTTELQTFTR